MPLTCHYILIRNYEPKTKKKYLYTYIDSSLVHNIAQSEKMCSIHKTFDDTLKKNQNYRHVLPIQYILTSCIPGTLN